jgi:murein hydrolase activator
MPPAAALRRPLAALLLLGLGLLALAGGAPGQPGGDRRGREEELDAVRARIATLRRQLETIKSQESSLEKELALVSTDLELQEVQVKEATEALQLASEQESAARLRVEKLKAELAAAREALRESVTALYVLGRHGYWRLFLQLKPDHTLLPAIRSLRFFILRDRQTLDKVEAAEKALVEESAYLMARRREVETWHRDEAARRDALAAARKRRAEVLERVSSERRRIAAETDLLTEKSIKLARFLNALVAGEEEPLRGKPIQDFRGVLDPPVAGEVAVPFGPRRDPRYQTEVPHHGIDFRTRRGTKVHTIFPGEVIYAADFEGYGPMVVVRHPGKVFTLCAGLELLSVAKGDVLSLGDVVGTAAETLYFELRVDNEPQDPARWLR